MAPASLLPQWRRTAERLGIAITVQSDQALSRGDPVPEGDLLVIDEAHRFRNPGTRRYDAIARHRRGRPVLLVTATPVVNRAADLVALLSLFLPDNGLAILGVPSLASVMESGEYDRSAQAASVLTVARPPAVLEDGDRLPGVSRSTVVDAPPLEPADLKHLLRLLADLRFPAFADRRATSLLSLQLRYRLASSLRACAESLTRHLAYLDHAIAAAARGERLSRRDARLLFSAEDELQLTLDLQPAGRMAAVDPADLTRERGAIEAARTWIRAHRGASPKTELLRAILATRGARKTIVFTTAVATAMDLACQLEWRRVAVVSGRGGWIASGPLDLETVLGMFAPHARGAPQPHAAEVVSTLIATDLVSEGLDLQDADAVVHYDLPWTSLRLEQRLGRVARLGSSHAEVDVWWFVPSPGLETGLELARRIAGKSRRQLQLGMATSSAVGKAQIAGKLFGWRERFARHALRPDSAAPVHSVVRAIRAAVFLLSWRKGPVVIPEVLVLEAGRVVTEEGRRSWLIERLTSAVSSDAPVPIDQVRSLRRIVRDRLRAAEAGAHDERSTALSRWVVNLATASARARNPGRLAELDRTLDLIHAGLAEGGLRTLGDLLGEGGTRGLGSWLQRLPEPVPGAFAVNLHAALFGTDT